MPSKTKKQHNAMEAAAHGHGTLGIPVKVAKEFVAADKAAGPIKTQISTPPVPKASTKKGKK